MNDVRGDVRLDKWLWAARFYKTRALCRQMIDSGKVHVDGQRGKPSKPVRIGQMITLRQAETLRTIEVIDISDKRGGAPQAALLYQETQESVDTREKLSADRRAGIVSDPSPDHRPSKKQRRDLKRFRGNQADD